MVTKRDRQAMIRRMVRSRAVGTQAEFMKALRKLGMTCDQATLSRDLSELGIRKSVGRYVMPGRAQRDQAAVDLSAVVHSFVGCGPHLIIVRTAVGQAQPVAVAIDAKSDPAIAATLAGDDTVFVATKNRRAQTVALRRLKLWFGEKHGR
jgi:transcriptional regulator of arginine metabolism